MITMLVSDETSLKSHIKIKSTLHYFKGDTALQKERGFTISYPIAIPLLLDETALISIKMVVPHSMQTAFHHVHLMVVAQVLHSALFQVFLDILLNLLQVH